MSFNKVRINIYLFKVFLAFKEHEVYHQHNRSPAVNVLGHKNPTYFFKPYIFTIHSNIILQLTRNSVEVMGLKLCYLSQFL
jgi:hypothetical protein